MSKKTKNLRQFMVSGQYLPRTLRDFHDQKEVFKAIDECSMTDPKDPPITWVAAHIYTIDKFLWFMARHGYTLQRSRQPIEFQDLQETLKQEREKRIEAFLAHLESQQKAA